MTEQRPLDAPELPPVMVSPVTPVIAVKAPAVLIVAPVQVVPEISKVGSVPVPKSIVAVSSFV